MSRPAIVLASRSPRRSQLLCQIGVPHEVLAVDFDEARLPGEAPRDYVLRVTRDKAAHARRLRADLAARPLLAADTSVARGDELLGKPRDEAECIRILGALSGRVHEVMTAVVLDDGAGLRAALSVSRVAFRAVGEAECRAYWATGEPADKAGAYAVQGLGAVFIERIEGSYSGVMGLPLFETAGLLAAAGMHVWQEAAAA
jgi:septum formation protein